MHIEVLLTGNEIMSGDTVDSNSSKIAHHLSKLGLIIKRKVTVGDDQKLLEDELKEMTSQADLVIMNGGLGPTVDDLTAKVVASVANVKLVEHPEAIQHLNEWCSKRNLSVNTANYKQAMLPENCDILANPIGSAVGFIVQIGECTLMCTPGVPGELVPMLDIIVERLSEKNVYSGSKILRLQTFGMGESTAQQLINDKIESWPDEVSLGFRASLPQLEIKLTISEKKHLSALLNCKEMVCELLGAHVIGEGETRLAEEVLKLLAEKKATLTTVESCTGGLIASMLTKESGASKSFHSGLVVYSDEMKKKLLNISQKTIESEGAVSDSVAREMARNALSMCSANYVIAVTGIAGPEGGTKEKPVGTVWLCWGTEQNLKSCCLFWPLERTLFQTLIAASGLDLIRRHINNLDPLPNYLMQKLID